MTRKTRKRLILIGIGLAVLAALVYGFLPQPVPVDLATVQRGPLQVIVEEEGETQVADTYVISSPVAAFARRIELEPGDRVERGQPVVRLEPPRAAILDPRTQAQARVRVDAAQAALAQAGQNAQAAAAAAQQAQEERQRAERLFAGGSATQQTLTQARSAADQTQANLDAAQAAVAAARAELTSARAALQQETAGPANLTVTELLLAPVGGRVLTVHRKSEGQVNPGEPLVELGDVDSLEVRVDVLSQDAVRIPPGTRVLLEHWGGKAVLDAVVSRLEPRGFTKVSSLGVEEKRVTVVANLTSPPALWEGLGAGYRVLARFIVWEDENVLLVPTGALFRTDDGWAVFTVEAGTAVRRPVEVGHQTGLAAEIVAGLDAGAAVIVHPANALTEGARVEPRGQ